MTASEQYVLEVLCIMRNKVTHWIKIILMCDQLNESSWAILSLGTVYSPVWCDSNFFKSMDEKTAVWQFTQMEPLWNSINYIFWHNFGQLN